MRHWLHLVLAGSAGVLACACSDGPDLVDSEDVATRDIAATFDVEQRADGTTSVRATLRETWEKDGNPNCSGTCEAPGEDDFPTAFLELVGADHLTVSDGTNTVDLQPVIEDELRMHYVADIDVGSAASLDLTFERADETVVTTVALSAVEIVAPVDGQLVPMDPGLEILTTEVHDEATVSGPCIVEEQRLNLFGAEATFFGPLQPVGSPPVSCIVTVMVSVMTSGAANPAFDPATSGSRSERKRAVVVNISQ